MTTPLLNGWDIRSANKTEWVAWGERGDARAKVLGAGDGYVLALVDAPTGYAGSPHEHSHTEFLYVISGRLRNEGRTMTAGDAYVASIGSHHTDFEAVEPSRYLSIFKL